MISFKGAHFPKEVILHAVFFYLRYGVSYRDLEEILAERGVTVDHATLNRWVVKYAPMVAKTALKRRTSTSSSWRLDETYIKVKGAWHYLYRAVDKHGQTIDFMLSECRDLPAAQLFLVKAIRSSSGLPEKCAIDKSGSNIAAFESLNQALSDANSASSVIVMQSKYLNNIIEQDHRFIKRKVRAMMGFGAFNSAEATLDGVEVANMIRRGQLGEGCPFAIFATLAA